MSMLEFYAYVYIGPSTIAIVPHESHVFHVCGIQPQVIEIMVFLYNDNISKSNMRF